MSLRRKAIVAKRKPGNNKRQPRYSGAASKCISIQKNGDASFFTPKKKQSGDGIVMIDGEFVRTTKERALR